MQALSRRELQTVVVIAVLIAWVIGIVISAFDGNAVLGVTTPAFTIVLGWVFTGKATEV